MTESVSFSANRVDYGFGNLTRLVRPTKDGRTDVAARREEGPAELSAEEQRRVQELKERDRQVRAHEQAHVSVGGDLVRGAANYSFETGPDQRRYAVAGEVSIDTSPGRTPDETIPKAQHIRETALAPVDPSPQDRRVAALASRMEGEARRQAAISQGEERTRAGSSSAELYRQVAGDSQPGEKVSVYA